MKDLLRIKSLISSDIEALLNQQVKKEAFSSSAYLAMASWCNRNGYDFSKYILDMGGNAVSPEVTGIKQEYNSFREVFEDAIDQEISVTNAIKNIYARCMKEQDFVTMEFLNCFLK